MIRPFLIAGVLAGAALAAASVARAQDGGEKAFNATCNKCHTVDKVVALAKKKEPDAAKRAPWLDGHLEKHFAPDAALRASIIAYIETRIAGAR